MFPTSEYRYYNVFRGTIEIYMYSIDAYFFLYINSVDVYSLIFPVKWHNHQLLCFLPANVTFPYE